LAIHSAVGCAVTPNLCVPETLSALLSWRNDRAVMFHFGHCGFAIQVEEPA
jgi:hypothetical protein